MRVLVTGGAGFIGSALVRYLIETIGAEVLTLDNLSYAGNLQSLRNIENSPNHQFQKVDITDRAAVDESFNSFQPEYVMHLAAESHVDRSIEGAAPFIQTNIVGTYVMLEAARTYWQRLDENLKPGFRFLHVSTDEVYGSLREDGLFTEQTPYDPSSPYSSSKAASDHLVTAWHRTYGLPVVISNCSNNYGPYQFPEKLIPLVILNALHGRELPVYGNGANIRDWLHVDDHVKALWTIVTTGIVGEKYNVGGHNEWKNIDVVKKICEVLDQLRPKSQPYSAQIKFVTDRPGHDARYAIDSSKIQRELGWAPEETFESGIVKTIEWYLANEWWWRPVREQRYAGERLGLSNGT